MSSHIATGTSGSRGQARYKLKHYYRKTNSNSSNRYSRRQEISHSNPERQPRRHERAFSEGRNVTQTNLPPIPRYSQRKPWVGIFGTEREPGKITILRRKAAEKPKGKVPSWLADTFGSLPKKHPLRETASDSVAVQSMTIASDDDDDNPFVCQPPGSLQAPTTRQNLTPSYLTQTEPTISTHPVSPHRMGLSSIPFAPPKFIESTYEDHYEDLAIPLNDLDYDCDPEYSKYLAGIIAGENGLESGLPNSRPVPQFVSLQRMSSPIILSDDYASSPIATTPVFNTTSSDDITLPTPTHNDVSMPETDEIQDALCTNHAFVTSMYASSPAGSFRGLPLNNLVGSRAPSPRGLVSTSRNISTPGTIHCHMWAPIKGALPQPHVQQPPTPSDIYKSRLLAYATAVADHMASSGDEGLVHQETNERVDPPETGRAAGSPVTQNTCSFNRPHERVLNTLSEGFESSGHRNDYSEIPGLYTKSLDPHNWIEPKLAKSPAASRLARIHTASSVIGTSKSDPNVDELDQTDLDGNSHTADTYLEDWKNESQSKGTTDELEEENMLLVSEYEYTQAENDALAADEPSDEESGPTEQPQVIASQQGSGVEHSVPKVDNAAPIIPEPIGRSPQIHDFLMKVSRRSPVRDTTVPGEKQPVPARLSPKFVPQPSRHVRPSPFAALLKKRFKDYPNQLDPNTAEPGGQADAWGDAAVEDQEDEIEPWSG